MRLNEDWLTDRSTTRVMDALKARGARALFVGGCVRNALIGAPVSDLDIATDALPEQVLDLAAAADIRTVPTGLDHGTVTLMSDGVPYEVTTFRRDVATDGRRATIAFSNQIEEDARRRDFTMNALYCEADGLVVDPLGGLPDLLARRVKFIDDAKQRIAEDYLRILRFFRFHAWYGDAELGFDTAGLAACEAGREGMHRLSKERIGAEMRKLLSAPNPEQSVVAMQQIGVLARVLTGGTARYLSAACDLERKLELAPDWQRRLAALKPEQPSDDLRLSRKEARYQADVACNLGNETWIGEVAYRTSADVATSVAILRAMHLGADVSDEVCHDIHIGANAVFPIRAKDLPKHYSGIALGSKLNVLKNKWISSKFTLTKESLLDAI